MHATFKSSFIEPLVISLRIIVSTVLLQQKAKTKHNTWYKKEIQNKKVLEVLGDICHHISNNENATKITSQYKIKTKKRWVIFLPKNLPSAQRYECWVSNSQHDHDSHALAHNIDMKGKDWFIWVWAG